MNQCPVVDDQAIPICTLLDNVETIILSRQRVGWICGVKLEGWSEPESVTVTDDDDTMSPEIVLAQAIKLAQERKEHDAGAMD
jgi:hypothetical protein